MTVIADMECGDCGRVSQYPVILSEEAGRV